MNYKLFLKKEIRYTKIKSKWWLIKIRVNIFILIYVKILKIIKRLTKSFKTESLIYHQILIFKEKNISIFKIKKRPKGLIRASSLPAKKK